MLTGPKSPDSTVISVSFRYELKHQYCRWSLLRVSVDKPEVPRLTLRPLLTYYCTVLYAFGETGGQYHYFVLSRKSERLLRG